MIEMLAAMYMVCTMSLSDPDISGPDTANMFPKQVITQQEPEPKKEQYVIKDYTEELKKLGYYKKSFKDEKLNLKAAIAHFQSDSNIIVTGQWNDQSLAALKKRLKSDSFSYTDSVDNPPSKGKWIAINKTKRILTLYEGTTVVRKFPVAIGNPSTPTPNVKSYIINKQIDPYWDGGGYAKPVKGGAPNNPLGHRWMGFYVEKRSGFGIHGNANEYSIGTSVSHGCVRMYNSDVLELYEIVSVNNPVWISDEAQLNKWGVKQPVYSD